LQTGVEVVIIFALVTAAGTLVALLLGNQCQPAEDKSQKANVKGFSDKYNTAVDAQPQPEWRCEESGACFRENNDGTLDMKTPEGVIILVPQGEVNSIFQTTGSSG
jgi:hypothetical protein